MFCEEEKEQTLSWVSDGAIFMFYCQGIELHQYLSSTSDLWDKAALGRLIIMIFRLFSAWYNISKRFTDIITFIKECIDIEHISNSITSLYISLSMRLVQCGKCGFLSRSVILWRRIASTIGAIFDVSCENYFVHKLYPKWKVPCLAHELIEFTGLIK